MRCIVIYKGFCFDVTQDCMNGCPMRLEPIRVGLIVSLTNHYATQGVP